MISCSKGNANLLLALNSISKSKRKQGGDVRIDEGVQMYVEKTAEWDF